MYSLFFGAAQEAFGQNEIEVEAAVDVTMQSDGVEAEERGEEGG